MFLVYDLNSFLNEYVLVSFILIIMAFIRIRKFFLLSPSRFFIWKELWKECIFVYFTLRELVCGPTHGIYKVDVKKIIETAICSD